MSTELGITGCLALAMLAVPGMVMAASTPVAAKTTSENREASRLLRDITSEARAIRMQARQVEKLSGKPGPTYQAYDRRWNDIEPKVEEMTRNLSRLEQIRGSALRSQQQAIDRSASLVHGISSSTEKLRNFLNENASNPSDPMFKTYGQTLAREAHELAMAARPAGGQSHSRNALGMKKGS